MKLKKLLAMVSVLALTAGMLGCGGKKEEAPEAPVEPEVKEEVQQEEPEEPEKSEDVEGAAVEAPEVPANQNLLTGLADLTEEAIGKRPVAVMVNNIQAAMPQYGVGQADIIYEMPVEGNQTRFMALYADYTQIPKICPIRSCRYYFPAVSEGYDAFYVHWGMDESVREYVEGLHADRVDGIVNQGNLFGRDQDKLNQGYALEHTATFDGTRFKAYTESSGLRTDLKEEKKGTAFQFNGMDEKVKAPGNDCTQVKIEFGAQSSSFTYDAEKQVYLKDINQDDQIDAKTGEQLAFANVIILETEVGMREDGDHRKIDWAGSANATGYYISAGGIQPIHWSKEEGKETSYLKLYDETGKEITVNRGKSYITYNNKGQATFQ